MDITGISTSLGPNGVQVPLTRHADIQPPDQVKPPNETRHEHSHGRRGHHGRALDIFRQELRLTLRAQFHARFAASQKEYLQLHNPQTPDAVAHEALGAARQLVDEAPTRSAQSLITFRARVHETASYVRETVRAEDDIEDVDYALAKVDQGLDTIEREVATNRESSASVLAVDMRSRQRSSIRIRTQEGDIVRFDLRRVDELSASDAAISDGTDFTSVTEVDVSSRSRLMLRVNGDLNDSELAAIQNVFSQAEEIANEFFDGDISAAFNAAQGFEFDAEQLARVNMRFRLQQVSNVTYSEQVSAPAVAPSPAPDRPILLPADVLAPTPRPDPVEPVTDDELHAEPILPTNPVETPTTEAPIVEPAPADVGALAGFFDLLSGFLRSIGDGFAAENGNASFQYHYSESFKLEILRAVIHAAAPTESTDAADNAERLIDGISGTATVAEADD